MTKAELNALLASPLSASALKKINLADLQAMILAEEAADADLHEVGSPEPAELDDDSEVDDKHLLATLASLTPAEQHLLVAFAHCENNFTNGAPKHAKVAADLETWVWLDDRKVGDMTVKQKKGVLSSLVKKSLVTVTPDSEGDLIGFTDAGFDAVMALLDDELPEIATPTPKAKKPANVVAMPTTKKARALEDRVLVAPTSDVSNVRPIREGTKRHAMVQALLNGCTLDQLATATGWKRDVASAAIYTDLKAAGLGVRRENGILHLMLPKGSNVVPLRPAAATADKAANR